MAARSVPLRPASRRSVRSVIGAHPAAHDLRDSLGILAHERARLGELLFVAERADGGILLCSRNTESTSTSTTTRPATIRSRLQTKGVCQSGGAWKLPSAAGALSVSSDSFTTLTLSPRDASNPTASLTS